MDIDWATLLGYSAAGLTTVSFIPQMIKTIRTKDASGVSLPMYFLTNIATLLWLAYGIKIQNYPIMASDGLALVFAVVILICKLKYSHRET